MTASSPMPARAAATARSSPTTNAVLTSSSATSAARRPGAAAPVASSKPSMPTVAPSTTTWLCVEPAVRDPRRVQRRDLLPQVGEHRVGDVRRVRVAQMDARERAAGDERGARPGGAGDDHRRHGDVGALGQEQRVGLRLDVLEPGGVQRGTAVLVRQRAPELRHELRVGLVATEDPHHQLAGRVAGRHRGPRARLLRQEVHVVGVHAELAERRRHLRGRGSPSRATRRRGARTRRAPTRARPRRARRRAAWCRGRATRSR